MPWRSCRSIRGSRISARGAGGTLSRRRALAPCRGRGWSCWPQRPGQTSALQRGARMMLLYPQALLLWLPLGLWLWRGARLTGPAMALRLILILVLGLALARPEANF